MLFIIFPGILGNLGPFLILHKNVSLCWWWWQWMEPALAIKFFLLLLFFLFLLALGRLLREGGNVKVCSIRGGGETGEGGSVACLPAFDMREGKRGLLKQVCTWGKKSAPTLD